VRAYNAGAPVLSFSLFLASFSESVMEPSLLLRPNLLATSRASTPRPLVSGSGDGDDVDDENDDSDCVGEVFDVFVDCENFDE